MLVPNTNTSTYYLLTTLLGVRLHPPGRTDKNLCRCFGAPARGFSLHMALAPYLWSVRERNWHSELLCLHRSLFEAATPYKEEVRGRIWTPSRCASTNLAISVRRGSTRCPEKLERAVVAGGRHGRPPVSGPLIYRRRGRRFARAAVYTPARARR